jgi:hypothetical protein
LFINCAIEFHDRGIGIDLHALCIHDNAMATFGFGDSVSGGAEVEDLCCCMLAIYQQMID